MLSVQSIFAPAGFLKSRVALLVTAALVALAAAPGLASAATITSDTTGNHYGLVYEAGLGETNDLTISESVDGSGVVSYIFDENVVAGHSSTDFVHITSSLSECHARTDANGTDDSYWTCTPDVGAHPDGFTNIGVDLSDDGGFDFQPNWLTTDPNVDIPMVVTGAQGDDTILTGSGDDTINAGDGNDTIDGGLGDDDLHGGANTDTVTYASRDDTAQIDAALGAPGTPSGDSVTDEADSIATDIENLTGSPGDDTLAGDGNPNVIDGGGGADTIDGNGASSSTDTLVGGDGPDTLNGSDDADVLEGGPGDDTLNGLGGDDSLQGGDDNDHLYGGAGNEGPQYLGDDSHRLDGGNGDDVIDGGPGNDVLETGPGADTFTGGDDFDTLSYDGYLTGVSVSMDGDANDGAPGEHDDVGNDIEEIHGSASADTISIALADVNTGLGIVYGGAGADTITGGLESDELRGDEGNDTIDGGDGNDVVQGGEGDDTLHGGEGADYIDYDFLGGGNSTSADGADVMDGGPGNDHVVYLSRTSGVHVSLDGQANDGDPTAGPQGEGDNVQNVEVVQATNYADQLSGGPAGGDLRSEGGDDTINTRDTTFEYADCGDGTDSAIVDGSDAVTDCETVDRSGSSPPDTGPTDTGPTGSTGGTPTPAAPSPPTNTSAPTAGPVTPKEGVAETGGVGGWSGTAPIRLSYQWFRCPPAGACSPIPGATGTAYTPTLADVQSRLMFTVYATNTATSQPVPASSGQTNAVRNAQGTTARLAMPDLAPKKVRGKWQFNNLETARMALDAFSAQAASRGLAVAVNRKLVGVAKRRVPRTYRDAIHPNEVYDQTPQPGADMVSEGAGGTVTLHYYDPTKDSHPRSKRCDFGEAEQMLRGTAWDPATQKKVDSILDRTHCKYDVDEKFVAGDFPSVVTGTSIRKKSGVRYLLISVKSPKHPDWTLTLGTIYRQARIDMGLVADPGNSDNNQIVTPGLSSHQYSDFSVGIIQLDGTGLRDATITVDTSDVDNHDRGDGCTNFDPAGAGNCIQYVKQTDQTGHAFFHIDPHKSGTIKISAERIVDGVSVTGWTSIKVIKTRAPMIHLLSGEWFEMGSDGYAQLGKIARSATPSAQAAGSNPVGEFVCGMLARVSIVPDSCKAPAPTKKGESQEANVKKETTYAIGVAAKGAPVSSTLAPPLSGTGEWNTFSGDGGALIKGQGTVFVTNPNGSSSVVESPTKGTILGDHVIAAGGGNVIAAGGGNVIAAGGGNVIAAGGGNVIAAGGGNVIAAGGGNVIAAGGGNVIAAGGGNLISDKGLG